MTHGYPTPYAEVPRAVNAPIRSGTDAPVRSATEQQMDLGDAYKAGRGVERDYAVAFEWYLKAAIGGNRAAQQKVGMAYAKGQGVKENHTLAQEWYDKSEGSFKSVAVAPESKLQKSPGGHFHGLRRLAPQPAPGRVLQIETPGGGLLGAK
jgi:TPR repeat protein